jgi:hypothetical protein
MVCLCWQEQWSPEFRHTARATSAAAAAAATATATAATAATATTADNRATQHRTKISQGKESGEKARRVNRIFIVLHISYTQRDYWMIYRGLDFFL